jgi:hypothetical protein
MFEVPWKPAAPPAQPPGQTRDNTPAVA